jgi:hypothetical protein
MRYLALLLFFLLAVPLHAAVRVEVATLPGHVEFRWTEDGKVLRTKLIRVETIYSANYTRIEKGPKGRIDLVLKHQESFDIRYENLCLQEFFDPAEAMKAYETLKKVLSGQSAGPPP